MTAERILAEYGERNARLDPLLPTGYGLPEPGPDGVRLVVPGGVGTALHLRPDLESLFDAFQTADQYRLGARVGGADPVAALDALLLQWRDSVLARATPGDPDSSAWLTWPSRDTAMARLFLARGLSPTVALAARPAHRPGPVPHAADQSRDPAYSATQGAEPSDAAPRAADRVRIRPLEPADVDAAVALSLEEIRWDEQFGGVIPRASTEREIRAGTVAAVERADGWSWLAEVDGVPAGLLDLQPPERAGWVAVTTRAAPVAYLANMVVAAAFRGGGVGARLVAHAHQRLDEAGIAVTLLHHSTINPLSGPFWHRCGYRPLWTTWEVRPASALR